jgi:hypothetical protein
MHGGTPERAAAEMAVCATRQKSSDCREYRFQSLSAEEKHSTGMAAPWSLTFAVGYRRTWAGAPEIDDFTEVGFRNLGPH